MIGVEEYHSNPDYKHCEYVDGEVVELNWGTGPHSSIKANCCALVLNHVDTLDHGTVAAGLHCRLTVNGGIRFRQPDICVSFDPHIRPRNYLEGGPEFVIEIRSPDDTIRFRVRKLEEYFANGCKLAWLVSPEEHTVEVFTPLGHVQILGPGDTLDGGDVLPGLAVPVNEVFE